MNCKVWETDWVLGSGHMVLMLVTLVMLVMVT